jgi:hypothetical protein
LAVISGWALAAVDLAFQLTFLAAILIAIAMRSWLGLLFIPALIAAYLLAVDALVPMKPISAEGAARARKVVLPGLLLTIIVIAAVIAMVSSR